MDFFNEFNNLQKEIFKNIFGNGQKKQEPPKNEVKRPISPKIEFKSPKTPKVSKQSNAVHQSAKEVQYLQTSVNEINKNGLKIMTVNPPTLIASNSHNGANNFGHQLHQQPKMGLLPNFEQNVSNPSIISNQNLFTGNFGGNSRSLNNLGLKHSKNYHNIQNLYENSQPTTHNLTKIYHQNNDQIQHDEKNEVAQSHDQGEIKSPQTKKQHKIKLPKRNQRSSPKQVDENSNYKPAAKKFKPNSSAKQKINIYETPRKSFLIPQAQESANKGLRRGRSKFRKSNIIMTPEDSVKEFSEMSQEEFLNFLSLSKNSA